MTQVGPAWVRVSFAADCSFSMRIQGLWFRVTERGRYEAESGVIVFHRRRGETRWPYAIVDGRLLLTEVDEVHAYRR